MLILLFNGSYLTPVAPTINVSETWFPGLVTVLQGVCPEATAIIKTANLNKANWENLIKADKLTLPYLLIESGKARQEDWGRDNISWRQSVQIHYIASVTSTGAAVSGGGYDAHSWAESRSIDISTSIASYTGSAFHVFNQFPSFSTNENSPANSVLYSLGVPYISSTVETELLWGASNLSGELWSV